MTFAPGRVYLATFLLSLLAATVMAAARPSRAARWIAASVAVGLSLAAFAACTPGLTLFTIHLSVLNGLCIGAAFWVVDRARMVSFRTIAPEVKYGLLVSVGVLAVMALPNVLRTSDEDEALAAGRRFVGLLREGDYAHLYNVLHPRLKDHAEWPDIRARLRSREDMFRHLSIREVVTHREFDEVICEADSRQKVVLRQAHFSGRGSVTDGKAMSLRDYENEVVLIDVLVGGDSIFAE